MNKIASFTINHLALRPGVYVSRRDKAGGEILTTFDIRMKRPNFEPVMNTAETHAIEHLGATFLRNHPVHADDIVYFGPMGCRTGFYLIMKGDRDSASIIPLMTEMFGFIAAWSEAIPGASERDCGNYLDMNLPMARYEAGLFLERTLRDIDAGRLVYPD